MQRVLYGFLLIGFLSGCGSEPSVQTVSQEEPTKPAEDDWIMLFDGTSLDGWRGYNAETMPPGWVIENGELTFSTEKKTDAEYEGGKDIIYAAEEFENFELYVEWKIPPGGNSGIMYHVK